MPVGTVVTGKMVAALKNLGFKAVFDTDLGADITIWEEAMEFLKKVQNNGPYPLFTSCCIGWLMQARNSYSDLLPHLSTSKSPVGMLGSVVKNLLCSESKLGSERHRRCQCRSLHSEKTRGSASFQYDQRPL
jgi:iron only hydrogenase large subunit-like protein